MKKKIFGGALLLAIAATAAFNLNFSMNENNKLSSLALADVEALANESTGGGDKVNCNCGLLWGIGCKADNYGATCWSGTHCEFGKGNCD